jgi:pimeloyl-ACP methyl ester carboxylesterase
MEKGPSMVKISLNGISLAFDRRGTGAPLLLVHGFPLDHTTWEPLLPHLEADFEVLMPDLRGFGQSDAPEGAYTIEQIAADLAALLDALKIQKTYLAGHSMGGYVALAFARAYPERVLGLGMVSSQVAADSPEGKAKRYATVGEVAVNGVSAVAGMSEKLSANPAHVAFFRELILRQRPGGVIGALKAMAERQNASQLFSTFKFPVVLVHGLADALIPPERSREMKALLPQAELTELPGVGHSPSLEAPVETARALCKFLV